MRSTSLIERRVFVGQPAHRLVALRRRDTHEPLALARRAASVSRATTAACDSFQRLGDLVRELARAAFRVRGILLEPGHRQVADAQLSVLPSHVGDGDAARQIAAGRARYPQAAISRAPTVKS